MEYWNLGMMDKAILISPAFHFSNIPLFQVFYGGFS